jgi:outer membrane protein TolC
MIKMKYFFLLIIVQVFWLSAQSQSVDALSIGTCYQKAKDNYPLIKRYDLVSRTAAYTIDNLQKGYVPQLSVSAQASYQSAVTAIPIKLPGTDIPALSKDQYKAYAQLDQLIYDGGTISKQKELQKNGQVVAEQQLTADLYLIRDRVNQLFFGILMVDEQLKQNTLLVADIRLGLNKIDAAVKNGTALRSNADLLNAEILKVNQHFIELTASRKALTDMLGFFTGLELTAEVKLIRPAGVNVTDEITRPELKVFEAQDQQLAVQNKLLTAATLPKIAAFLQGGYGRPGLDMLKNDFQGYYIGGIRLNWSPSSFYTLKKQRALLDISRREIDVKKETFLFNTRLTLKQQNAEIGKFDKLLATDDEIIALQKKVKAAALAQLQNGVITSNDFLKEVNDENQARQNKLTHQTQLLIAQYNQQNTTGYISKTY